MRQVSRPAGSRQVACAPYHAAITPAKKLKVVALALPRVVAFDLAIPAQTLGHDDERDWAGFSVATPGGPSPVPSTTAFDVSAAHGLDEMETADVVIVPGFVADTVGPRVTEALRAAHRRRALLVSICTGAFALAEAGLLDGRAATTHWRDAPELARRFPRVDVRDDVLFHAEDDICSSAGVAAGIDLCLHLVGRWRGSAHAARIAQRMVVAPTRQGGQRQYAPSVVRDGVAGSDARLAATLDWARQRLHEPLTVPRLAAHAGWSPRSLLRRFERTTGMSPGRWVASQRVDRARQYLELTDMPVEAVAERCGYATSEGLRDAFRRALGTTPGAYRRAWGR